ncbi:MAG: flavin reductase family protein [Erysipelotrichaceae bacterium]|mgnify:CR=1 FL=1|nr:flavin reductase family protein [Erysipelotrichaceae bacterium]
MRKDFGPKPFTYPQPVFIIATYDENGNPDAMNAAWGGISCDTEICLCLSEGHKTTQNILKNKEFTVHMATADYVVPCDYVGVVSGNKEANKIEKAGFHVVKSEKVNAPIIEELPMCLECRLISYETETCHLFADIVNVSADESVLTDGKIDIMKLKPITFDPCAGAYHVIGEKVGNAFKDGLALK